MNLQFSRNEIKSIVDSENDLRRLLFPYGFILTNDFNVDSSAYPFYNEWQNLDFCGYRFLLHFKQKIYTSCNKKCALALVGHAYNPLTEQASEKVLVENALQFYTENREKFTEYFNMWTGTFALFIFDNNQLHIYGDAAGMYTIFYGLHNKKFYCSSHSNLIGDVCCLDFDEYVNELINYRFYRLFGKSLPGDISPFENFKRVIPNHYVTFDSQSFQKTRFFLTGNNDLSYEQIVEKSAQILSSSMKLISQKWDNAAISLSGGCDSKTTLSCTNGLYDKFKYFSYSSSVSEEVDAVAASKICNMLGLKHIRYDISTNDDDFGNIEIIKKIMEYNSGSIGKDNSNDIRKRAFFINCTDFDIEVKSWVSEVARAYYHKRFNKKRFPKKLTAKYATNLYKVFITNGKLIRKTDKIFEDFLNEYYKNVDFKNHKWYDLLFWEFRMSSWNGLVITGEHRISSDITIPYNNRCLLQLMLSTPIEYRINDKIHMDIMKLKNTDIANCNISVVNVKHTKKRANFEKLYLSIFSKIRF